MFFMLFIAKDNPYATSSRIAEARSIRKNFNLFLHN